MARLATALALTMPLLAMPLLAGCTAMTRRPASVATVVTPAAEPLTGWRAIALPADQRRLDALPTSWTSALAAVPRSSAVRVKAEGTLLDPAAALDLPALPPGPYHCRLIRLGGRAGIKSYPPDFCTVGGDTATLSITKMTGDTLPGGWLHPDTDRRLIFLGTFRPRAAAVAPGYGHNPAIDVAGVVERVGPFRWRLVLVRGSGTPLDIYELVPVTPLVPGAPPAVPAKRA